MSSLVVKLPSAAHAVFLLLGIIPFYVAAFFDIPIKIHFLPRHIQIFSVNTQSEFLLLYNIIIKSLFLALLALVFANFLAFQNLIFEPEGFLYNLVFTTYAG